MKRTFHQHCIITLLGVLLTLALPAQVNADENAIAVVERLHEALLTNMKQASSLGFKGRYENIAPVIEQTFDFPLIAKVILSRHWSKLSKEKQQTFVDRLIELTKSTYAARFNGYNDESFQINGSKKLRKGRKLIESEIQSSEETVSLNYLMHPVDDEWRIISVIANGVNDLSLKRAEYSRIISQDGFDKLLEIINQKIREYEQQEDLSS